jgi:hypothetical protein
VMILAASRMLVVMMTAGRVVITASTRTSLRSFRSAIAWAASAAVMMPAGRRVGDGESCRACVFRQVRRRGHVVGPLDRRQRCPRDVGDGGRGRSRDRRRFLRGGCCLDLFRFRPPAGWRSRGARRAQACSPSADGVPVAGVLAGEGGTGPRRRRWCAGSGAPGGWRPRLRRPRKRPGWHQTLTAEVTAVPSPRATRPSQRQKSAPRPMSMQPTLFTLIPAVAPSQV